MTCLTLSVGSEDVTGWNPWRVLRRREHLKLQYAYLHPSRGAIVDHGNGLRTITLDRRLDRVDRNDVLSHELVHDELDLLWPEGTPPAIIQKGERLVTRISDERLLPPADLAEYLATKDDEMVLARMVAEDLEVSIGVADRSLRRLVAGF